MFRQYPNGSAGDRSDALDSAALVFDTIAEATAAPAMPNTFLRDGSLPIFKLRVWKIYATISQALGKAQGNCECLAAPPLPPRRCTSSVELSWPMAGAVADMNDTNGPVGVVNSKVRDIGLHGEGSHWMTELAVLSLNQVAMA